MDVKHRGSIPTVVGQTHNKVLLCSTHSSIMINIGDQNWLDISNSYFRTNSRREAKIRENKTENYAQ